MSYLGYFYLCPRSLDNKDVELSHMTKRLEISNFADLDVSAQGGQPFGVLTLGVQGGSSTPRCMN